MGTVEGPGTVQHVGASSTLLPRPILHDDGAAHVQDPSMESVLLIFDEPVKVLEGSPSAFPCFSEPFASRTWIATSVFAAPWSHGSGRGRAWKCHEASANPREHL